MKKETLSKQRNPKRWMRQKKRLSAGFKKQGCWIKNFMIKEHDCEQTLYFLPHDDLLTGVF